MDNRENLEKRESIFQSENFDQTGKVKEIIPKILGKKSRNFDIGKILEKVREIYQPE